MSLIPKEKLTLFIHNRALYWGDNGATIYRRMPDTEPEKIVKRRNLGPIAYCSKMKRLYFVQEGNIVRYVETTDEDKIYTVFTSEGEISNIQLAPNSLLYSLSESRQVRRFTFANKERSVFLRGTSVNSMVSYKRESPKPGMNIMRFL